MKPPPFDYLAPTTVEEAVDALAEPGAMVLAGGQSLLLELSYRAHHPRLLVDINGLTALDTLTDGDDGLTIGALVRHRELERPTEDGGPVRRLLSRIAPYVAHPPIRNRGTFCGSLAWGHPAAEWNAVAVAFGAAISLRSRDGSRVVDAEDFFLGTLRTSRRPDELVTSVRLRALPPTAGTGFAEHRRTHASFAEVAVVAAVTLTAGLVQEARLAVAGVDEVPVRLTETEGAMVGVEQSAAAGWVRQQVGGWAASRLDDHRAAVTAELAGRAVGQAVSGR